MDKQEEGNKGGGGGGGGVGRSLLKSTVKTFDIYTEESEYIQAAKTEGWPLPLYEVRLALLILNQPRVHSVSSVLSLLSLHQVSLQVKLDSDLISGCVASALTIHVVSGMGAAVVVVVGGC